MFDEFYAHLTTPNPYWAIGAIFFGFFAGRIFKHGTLFFAIVGYAAFVYPTMKMGGVLQAFNLNSAFTQSALEWGITPWDLSSIVVASAAVVITSVFWALNQ